MCRCFGFGDAALLAEGAQTHRLRGEQADYLAVFNKSDQTRGSQRPISATMSGNDTGLCHDLAGGSQFVTMQLHQGVLTVKPAGPTVGQREAAIIADEISAELDGLQQRPRVLLLDLSEIRVLSSAGLGMCIELRQRAYAGQAETIIFGLCDELEQLLRALKTEHLWRFAHDADDLCRALAA